MFSYDISNRLLSKGTLTISKPPVTKRKLEFNRQGLHIFIGILIAGLILFFTNVWKQNGLIYLEFLVALGLIVLLIAINDRIKKSDLPKSKLHPLSNMIFGTFERIGVTPGYGAFWYGMGVLFSFVFIHDINFLIATIIALGVGDGIATLVGKNGRIKNPLNAEKTIEGTMAFFLSTALLTLPFIGAFSVPFAFITSLDDISR